MFRNINFQKPQQSVMRPSASKLPGFQVPAKGGLVPQYPGQNEMSFEQMQAIINNAWKVRGFTIALAAASISRTNIGIAGDAKYLLGISLHSITNFAADAAMPQSASLIINNEALIQEMPWTLLDIKYMTHIFYPFERPLSGNDQIILEINNPLLVQTVGAAFYYR